MSSDRATYRKIAADLRAQIESGQLAAGAQLPTQQELAERYGVARMTARQALAELINEGLIRSQQGKGTIVRQRHHMVYRPQSEFEPRISQQMDRFMSSLSQSGREPSQSIDVAIVPASPHVASRLDVEPGAPVVVRKRVRSIDGEPFNINDTYYRYDHAIDTDIMNPADIPQGSNNILADKGLGEVRAIDEIYIRMPEQEEIRRLELSPGTPVACHYVTGYATDNTPVRCDVFILPGDRHVILYERSHPGNADDLSHVVD